MSSLLVKVGTSVKCLRKASSSWTPRLTTTVNAGFAAGFLGHRREGGSIGGLAQGLLPLLQDSAGAGSLEGSTEARGCRPGSCGPMAAASVPASQPPQADTPHSPVLASWSRWPASGLTGWRVHRP